MIKIENLRKARPAEIDPARWDAAIQKLELADGDEIAKIAKGASMNPVMAESIAKGMADAIEARPEIFDAPTIKRYLDDLVKAEHRPLEESGDQAFARIATTHETGKRLFRALRKRQAATGEPDHLSSPEAAAPPASHASLMNELIEQHIDADPELQKLRASNPTRAKARGLMRALQTPEGQRVWRKHRAEQISN